MQSEYEYYKQSFLKSTLLNKILSPILTLSILGLIYIVTQSLSNLYSQLPYILILLLSLVLYLRNTYIKYLLMSSNFKHILKNYDYEPICNLPIHKDTKTIICPNCLKLKVLNIQ